MGMFVFPNAGAALEFWEQVIYKEAVTERERIDIAVKLVKDGKAELVGFEGTEEDLMKELGKAFSVLSVKKKGAEPIQ